MTTLSELFQIGYKAYKDFNSQLPPSNLNRFTGLEVQALPVQKRYPVQSNSNYLVPIQQNSTRLAGYGRGWGEASIDTQHEVMDMILTHSKHLSAENQAILLATARLESGFNPDAAALSSSASGVFQLVKQTALNVGLNQENIFDAEQNVIAGVTLFEENVMAVNKRYPKLSGNERAVILYAFHHDGPSLSYGGEKIARQKMVPFLDEFREVTYYEAFNEPY